MARTATLVARRSGPADWLAIETLNHAARRVLPKLWWWEDFLSQDPFVVVEQGRVVVGALFAWPDESPVAWVRLASLMDSVNVQQWLDTALPPVARALRLRGVRSLAWMDYWNWAGSCLGLRGFTPLTDVETMAKYDHQLAPIAEHQAVVRPAVADDIAAVAAVDAAAFSAHWRNSQATVARRFQISSLFIVAEHRGNTIGYAEGDLHCPSAHLNRVAVHPNYQGNSVGALLTQRALSGFWQGGANYVTLNTQAHNDRARRLYKRLGFEPTGERATAWELLL